MKGIFKDVFWMHPMWHLCHVYFFFFMCCSFVNISICVCVKQNIFVKNMTCVNELYAMPQKIYFSFVCPPRPCLHTHISSFLILHP